MSNWVSTLLSHSNNRAFSNLFEVILTPPRGINESPSIESKYFIESIEFSGMTSIKIDTENSMRTIRPTDASKITRASLSFRETSDLKITKFLRRWMEEIFDFKSNCYTSKSPFGKITINLDYTPQGSSVKKITMEDVFPISLKLPDFQWKNSTPLLIKCDFNVNMVKFTK